MDIGDILKTGAMTFIGSKGSGDAGSGLDIGKVVSALGILGGGEAEAGDGGSQTGLNIGSLVGKLTAGGLGGVVESWLGDGKNEDMSEEQVTSAMGSDTISKFASILGISDQEAAGGLKDALPGIVDQSSRGGSLLDSIGGAEGIAKLAGGLF